VRRSLERRPWSRPDLVFVLLCAVTGVVRAVILASPYAPSGIDPGNWLAFGNGLLGNGVRSSTIVYPPLIPLVVRGATAMMGPVTGIAAIGALAALAPAVGVYVVLRAHRIGWTAVLAAGLLLPAASVGEPAAWGGYPQLVGLGLLVAFLWRLDRFLLSLELKDAAIAGTVLAAELASSHLTATLAVACGALVVLGRVIVDVRRIRGRIGSLLRGLAVLPLPSLPLLPIYLGLADAVLPSFGDRSPAARLPGRARDLARAVDSLFTEFPLLWRGLVVLALITPLLLLNRRRSTLWLTSTSLTVCSVVFVAGFHEYRFSYLAPIAGVAALGCWLEELRDNFAGAQMRRVRYAVVGVLALLLVLEASFGLRRFSDQRKFYALLTPKAVTALEWLREETPRDDLVAVPDMRGYPYGWWVEGLGERRSLTASRLQWLNFEDERRRARIANILFHSTAFPNQGTLRRARHFGVDVLFIVKSWPSFKAAQLEKLRIEVPDVILYENEDVVLVRVGDTS
jgi:hypothetical protein